MRIEKHQIVGLIGPVIAYQSKGKTLLRTRPQHYHDRRSSAQLQQRSRMQQSMDFLRPLLPWLKPFYLESDGDRDYLRSLLSRTLKGSFDPSTGLLLPQCVSPFNGSLVPPEQLCLTSDGEHTLLQWNDNSLTDLSRADDHLLVLCYDAVSHGCWISETDEVLRSHGCCRLEQSFSSGCHIYVAFINHNRTRISATAYVRG